MRKIAALPSIDTTRWFSMSHWFAVLHWLAILHGLGWRQLATWARNILLSNHDLVRMMLWLLLIVSWTCIDFPEGHGGDSDGVLLLLMFHVRAWAIRLPLGMVHLPDTDIYCALIP